MGSGFKKILVGIIGAVMVLNLGIGVLAQQQVPCYFVFGDSLVDNGNNNFMFSLAQANYLPYGIDFPVGPTGRFSNGKTVIDVVGEFLFLRLSFCPLLIFYLLLYKLAYRLFSASKNCRLFCFVIFNIQYLLVNFEERNTFASSL